MWVIWLSLWKINFNESDTAAGGKMLQYQNDCGRERWRNEAFAKEITRRSNDALRCIRHHIVPLHLPFVSLLLRATTAKKRKQPKNACTFSSFFSSSLSFPPERPARKERVKGDASPYLRAACFSPRPCLSLPAFLRPLLFYLRSRRNGTRNSRRGRGRQERKGAERDCKFNDNTTKDVYSRKKNTRECVVLFFLK